MWKSLPTDYCTRLISWLCNDFVTLTTIIDFQGVRKDWNCPPIPEKKSEKTQNLSFSVWLLTRLFFLPSTDHKTLFCWSVPLGLPQASFLQNWREEKKFRVAEIRLQKPKNRIFATTNFTKTKIHTLILLHRIYQRKASFRGKNGSNFCIISGIEFGGPGDIFTLNSD